MQRVSDREYEITLADALVLLVRPAEVVPGASWHFRLDGDNLVLTRSTREVEAVVDEGDD